MAAPPTVLINADVGESIAIHSFGNDDALLRYVDTINVACGMHSGGPSEMAEAVVKAAAAGVTIGAHPGLPDIAGFGRRRMALAPAEVRDLVMYQVGALTGFLRAEGLELHHIKPHGALYSMVAEDDELMDAVCDVASVYGVPVFGLPGTAHERVARRRGVDFVGEFFVDLDYDDEGRIAVARRAVARDIDDVERRASLVLRQGVATAASGKELHMSIDSFCVHSDIPNAPQVAQRLREVLRETIEAREV